ncbi:Zn-ribbon domain-containing OB-fold protein [Embleya sp. AB8]|uniref:Zn-ribbon domain-containing OB-fold protein n=1 Tax=Embleya sp. AB8 TaxID=3156304 RepID=UPI003C71D3D4
MTPVLGPQIGVPVTPAASVRVPPEPGELRYQRCAECEAANFAPTELCRGCSSGTLHWATSAGRGSVYSWTVVRRPAGRGSAGSYAVAIVDLDEGYRMLTNLVEVEPTEIHSGMRVRVDLRPTGEERILPFFTPDHG